MITEPHSDTFSKSAISVLKMQNFPKKMHSNSKSKGKRALISLQRGYLDIVLRCKDCIELMKVLTHFSSKMSDLAHCALTGGSH